MSGNVSPDWNTHGECGWCKGITAKAPQCWCAHCHNEVVESLGGFEVLGANAFSFHHMYLCPDCGNKRCPRATSHALDCSGSNAPGQPGSRYGGLSA